MGELPVSDGRIARRALAAIPGPKQYPVVGSAARFRYDLLGTLLAGRREYGDLVRYEAFPGIRRLRQTLVVAHHPDDIRHVLTQTERSLCKDTPGFRVLAEMLGNGLLTTEGDVWRRQRRTVQPLFTPRTVIRYAELMAEEAARLEVPPGVVDLHLAMLRYTLRVVGRALFSEDIDDTVPALHRIVPRMSDLTVRRTFQMFRRPLSVPTPRNLVARRLRAQQYAIVDRILARPSLGDHDDLLTRLRAARDPETGDPLSDQELRDQILVFLLAGHETTAGALTFSLHLLGRHPAAQEAVASELAEVLDGRPAPSPEDLPRLVRTRAALLEGMRLYPPAYLTERMVATETTLRGHTLPRRVMVVVAPWSTHRHPEFWPDPERYDPGRFVGEHNRPHYAYFPFGGGPRACVGEHFAVLEATVLLATLLARYRVTAVSPDLPVKPLITLRPMGRVPVRLEPRTR
jgi:cytochrome P450